MFTIALIAAALAPSFANMIVLIRVPPGTVSVTVTVSVAFTNGTTQSQTDSYCPAGPTISVELPTGPGITGSAAAGFFQNANGIVTDTFDVNPGSGYVDDPEPGDPDPNPVGTASVTRVPISPH
jgi:hypothetical protein